MLKKIPSLPMLIYFPLDFQISLGQLKMVGQEQECSQHPTQQSRGNYKPDTPLEQDATPPLDYLYVMSYQLS